MCCCFSLLYGSQLEYLALLMARQNEGYSDYCLLLLFKDSKVLLSYAQSYSVEMAMKFF